MKPWTTVDRDTAPGGGQLALQERDGQFAIRIDGKELMSSRSHGSEEALARFALQDQPHARVLLGGLGLGYTLRAALDLIAPDAEVVVVELSAAVVRWVRGPLRALTHDPLADRRVRVEVSDVRAALRGAAGGFDAILLDVDNGPSALTTPANAALYGRAGVELCLRALRPGGRLAVWSAGPDAAYLKRLGEAGFEAACRAVPARSGSANRHALFIGRKPAAPPRTSAAANRRSAPGSGLERPARRSGRGRRPAR